MPPSLVEPLRALYGERAAGPVAQRLERLLAQHQARLPSPIAPREHLGLTERDALLITYGDQISEPGKPPLQTLANFLDRHGQGIVSGVHLLPFYPSSSDDGFSVTDYLQVDPTLGTWEDIALVGHEFDLMFDAVFNHMSAQSEWFQRFLAGDPAYADLFVTVEGSRDLSQVVRPRALPLLTEFPTATGVKKVWTTFSADQVDLNLKNPKVLLLLLDVLLFYVERGARYLRLDAIAYLWKEIGTPCIHLPQTHRIIQLMRAVLDHAAPQTLLITETNVPHADNLSYFGDGRNEAQLVYNFALPPLVLHSFHTGNAERLTRWAQTLALPSSRVTFFNFLASHDGIGVNPARGILEEAEIQAMVVRTQAHGGFVSYKHLADGSQSPYELNINYLDVLSDPAAFELDEIVTRRFLTAQAIMLALRGVPGIYFHSLLGSRGDRAGAESSGIKRRINREKFSLPQLEHELADPTSLRAQIFRGYRELLIARQQHGAFAPTSSQTVLELDPRIFAVLRETHDGRDRLLCLHNVSPETVNVPADVAGFTGRRLGPFARQWIPLA